MHAVVWQDASHRTARCDITLRETMLRSIREHRHRKHRITSLLFRTKSEGLTADLSVYVYIYIYIYIYIYPHRAAMRACFEVAQILKDTTNTAPPTTADYLSCDQCSCILAISRQSDAAQMEGNTSRLFFLIGPGPTRWAVAQYL
jgi:hypothetical protein